MVAPNIPCESIIQNNTKEPIKGVTIIGSMVPKITIPLTLFANTLTERATKNHKTITNGVTEKQKVNVNSKLL